MNQKGTAFAQLSISETGSVQFPMVQHVAEIGWTPLAPEVAKQKRAARTACFCATNWRPGSPSSTPG